MNGVGSRIVYGRCEAHSVKLELSSDSPAIRDAGAVTVSYDTSQARHRLISLYDIEVRSFTNWLDGREATSPTLSVARVEGSQLMATFSEPLDAGSAPPGNAFTVSGGRTGTGTVAIAGATATVTLDSAVADGETVTVSYARPGTNPLRDPAGNPVANFRDATLYNVTGPPSFGHASVNGETLVMTFDEPLDAGSAPAPGAFHVTVGNSQRDVAAGGVAIRGADVVLTLASAVGRQMTYVRYTRPSANWLRDLAGNAVATFADQYVHPHETCRTRVRR